MNASVASTHVSVGATIEDFRRRRRPQQAAIHHSRERFHKDAVCFDCDPLEAYNNGYPAMFFMADSTGRWGRK